MAWAVVFETLILELLCGFDVVRDGIKILMMGTGTVSGSVVDSEEEMCDPSSERKAKDVIEEID